MKKNETPFEFLSRAVSWLNMEHGEIIDDLPTIEAVIDYFNLWAEYDTDFLQGIIEAIDEGDSPDKLNNFIDKYKLPWVKQ